MRHFNKFIATLLIALIISGAALATTIPLQTGPVDPSGWRGVFNSLINSLNGYFTGGTAFSALELSGSTSGNSTLQAPATGGGTTTLPSGTGTLAYAAGGTFTNPTLSGATLSGTTAITGPVTTQGQVFSTTPSANPLMLMTAQNVPTASINASGGYAFLSGVTGRTIYPGIPVLTALGGNAGGATRIIVECSPGGNVLASVLIAYLTSANPVIQFASTNPGNQAGVLQGYDGCASGDSVIISASGAALTTATSIFVNMPFTVQ